MTAEIGVSSTTLINWERDLKEKIDSLRAVELEALYDEFYLSMRKQVEFFGDILSRMHREPSQRARLACSNSQPLPPSENRQRIEKDRRCHADREIRLRHLSRVVLGAAFYKTRNLALVVTIQAVTNIILFGVLGFFTG